MESQNCFPNFLYRMGNLEKMVWRTKKNFYLKTVLFFKINIVKYRRRRQHISYDMHHVYVVTAHLEHIVNKHRTTIYHSTFGTNRERIVNNHNVICNNVNHQRYYPMFIVCSFMISILVKEK